MIVQESEQRAGEMLRAAGGSMAVWSQRNALIRMILAEDKVVDLEQQVQQKDQQLAALREGLTEAIRIIRDDWAGDVAVDEFLARADALLEPPQSEGPSCHPPGQSLACASCNLLATPAEGGEHCLCACGVSADSELGLELHFAKNHRPSDDEQADQQQPGDAAPQEAG